MKKGKCVLSLGLAILLITACGSSASEDFEGINGQVKKKRLKTISAVDEQVGNEKMTAQFIYDSDNKLINVSATKAVDAALINYSNDGTIIKLANGSDPYESISIEELYKSPYELYETGEVIEYDSNKNPSKVLFKQNEYNYITDKYTVENYTAEMVYDDKPNLYFYTLESAGLIDVLDGVNINIGINTKAPELIKARALLPVNNLVRALYKDADDNIIGTLDIEYTYDVDGYPIKGNGNGISDSGSVNVEVTYSYY